MTSSKTKVFISYKRNIDPDDRIAHQVFKALDAMPNIDVFMDITMGIGVPWAQQIEKEIKSSDFMISFLSKSSVQSEMVVAEIETAHHWGKEHGSPRILPVRLAFTEPLEYPLSAYLNPLNWVEWHVDNDTALLVSKLIVAISSSDTALSGDKRIETQDYPQVSASPPPQSTTGPAMVAQPFELPEGTMRPDSQYYIERDSDTEALNAIEKQGVTISIKGPRQIGKSSLLMRLIDRTQQHDRQVVFIDFQLFDSVTRSDPEKFFKRFTRTIVRKLKLPNEINSFWDDSLGHSQLCTEYMEDYVLPKLEQPILLAMDEVESVFESSFRTDFFGMLRAWHNMRAFESSWQNVSLALVTSTEPYQFIRDLDMSPFNVGVTVAIEDFSRDNVDEINTRYGSLLTIGQIDELYQLLEGHPYLTRRAIYLLSTRQIQYRDLISTASKWDGPFGDHLRYHLFRLQRNTDFVETMMQIVNGTSRIDDDTYHRLQGAGLIKRTNTSIIARCKLYADFFREYLNG